jgi:hypothetical protein
MPDTLLSSLSSTLKLTTREEVARFLGESEPAVSRGLEFATSAVFDGLHRQTGQSDIMRQVIDLASKAPADMGAALSTGQLGNPNSPLILSGKKLLSFVLGQSQDAMLNTMGRESGLRPTSAATVLALAAQSVLSFIGARVRNDGMTATSLATFLHSEGSAVRSGFAAEFQAPAATRVTAPTETMVTRRVEVDPVIAQTVQKERSVWLWLLPLLLIVGGLLLWFLFRPHPAPVAEAPAPPPIALLAKGYSEQHPVRDNATEAGRAQNRRISMLVTQK